MKLLPPINLVVVSAVEEYHLTLCVSLSGDTSVADSISSLLLVDVMNIFASFTFHIAGGVWNKDGACQHAPKACHS